MDAREALEYLRTLECQDCGECFKPHNGGCCVNDTRHSIKESLDTLQSELEKKDAAIEAVREWATRIDKDQSVLSYDDARADICRILGQNGAILGG